MKRYVKAATTLKQGSMLLKKNGTLIDVMYHVPSTTYMSRNIYHLCCTDGQFLYDYEFIEDYNYETIVRYCYYEYLTTVEGKSDNDQIGIIDSTKFNAYAELRYAPTAKPIIMKLRGTVGSLVANGVENDFNKLNATWYEFLRNNYVKVSRFGNVVEFRITSDNGFDWNKVIIDDCILKYDNGGDSTRYNIIKEFGTECKTYFVNATLSDILKQDKIILSSETFERKVLNGEVVYVN